MPSSLPTSSGLVRTLSRAAALVVGLVLALAGFAFMLGALLLGVAVAALLWLWAWMRGRRPAPMAFVWRSRPGTGRTPGATPSQAPSTVEVVDVKVREIPD